MARGPTYSQGDIDFLKQNYLSMPASKISEMMGRSLISIYSYVSENREELGLPRGGSYWNRKTFDKTPSPTFSYILGVLYGDGWVRSCRNNGCFNYRVGLKAKDIEFVESFRRSLITIGLRPSKIRSRRDKNHDNWSTQFEMEAHSKLFYEWFKSLTLDQAYGLLQTPEMKREFVRGFYESEGCLHWQNKENFNLTLVNTNLKLLKMVKRILDDLGFDFYLYNGKKIRENWSRLYCLRINKRKSIERFLAEINPCIPRKSSGRLSTGAN